MRQRLNSLRARLALILGAVLLVPFAYTVIQALHAYEAERARQLETLQRTARLISTYQADFFEETERLLSELGGQAEVRGMDRYACSSLLIDTLGSSLKYGSFTVTDEAGTVRCSSAPELLGIHLAKRDWFDRLRAGKSFSVSEVVNGRAGTSPTLVAAVPLRGVEGQFKGTVSASVELALLDRRMRELSLPEDASVFLIDQQGEPLERDPARDSRPGAPTPQAFAPAAGAATIDQIERRYITAAIERTPLSVVVGLPEPDEWSWLERNLAAELFGPILMLALALGAVWIATDLLVNRHISALARTARAYSGGHFGAKPKVAGAPTELRELGVAFTRMAEQIRVREADLKTSLEQKDALLREIHHRVKNNLQVVTSLLSLRARALDAPPARAALHEAQTRITALALVYRFLYENNDLDVVDLDRLVRELSDLLADSAGPGDGRIELKVETEPVELATTRAISVALWLTEALTNAFGHAFPGRRRGTIEVTLRRLTHDWIELEVTDDGIGMPSELTQLDRGPGAAGGSATLAQAEGTLGLTLIAMLARQIGGQAHIERQQGTRVVLGFPRRNGSVRDGTSAAGQR